MRRVEDVLGKGWENHVEGQRLKADGDSFRQKLNTQELFDEWSRKVRSLNQALNQVKFGLTLLTVKSPLGGKERKKIVKIDIETQAMSYPEDFKTTLRISPTELKV